jgi:hypothetical protein
MCSSTLSCPFGSLVPGQFSAHGGLFQWRRCGTLRAGARGQGSLSDYGRERSGDAMLLLVQARTATLLTALLLRELPSTPPGASLSFERHRGLQLLFLCFSFVLLLSVLLVSCSSTSCNKPSRMSFINLKLGTLCLLFKNHTGTYL